MSYMLFRRCFSSLLVWSCFFFSFCSIFILFCYGFLLFVFFWELWVGWRVCYSYVPHVVTCRLSSLKSLRLEFLGESSLDAWLQSCRSAHQTTTKRTGNDKKEIGVMELDERPAFPTEDWRGHFRCLEMIETQKINQIRPHELSERSVVPKEPHCLHKNDIYCPKLGWNDGKWIVFCLLKMYGFGDAENLCWGAKNIRIFKFREEDSVWQIPQRPSINSGKSLSTKFPALLVVFRIWTSGPLCTENSTELTQKFSYVEMQQRALMFED